MFARHMMLITLGLLFSSMTGSALARVNVGGPKMILDNDWSSSAAGQFLMALDYGYDILGLVGDTANSWALQTSLHALALLEAGDLSCIPVYKGADYPLLNTPKLMSAYQALQGPLVWQGVFKPENLTAEALGFDTTGGNPNRISRAAFVEGFPNNTLAGNYSAAWMIEQVHKYPGEVTIYSGGSLTNIALAVRLDPEFASLTAGLYIMGGYVDVNLLTTSGDLKEADINTDINFKTDPEAVKIALTADFPNITLVSNAANAHFVDEDWLAETYKAAPNRYTKLALDTIETDLPLWDEIAMVAAIDSTAVLNSTKFYANVETSFYSPFYGNVYAYQRSLIPPAQDLREVNFIYATNGTAVKSSLRRALQYPKKCN